MTHDPYANGGISSSQGGTSGGVLPAGRYLAVINSVEPRVVSKSNPDKWFVTLDLAVSTEDGSEFVHTDRIFLGYPEAKNFTRAMNKTRDLIMSVEQNNDELEVVLKSDSDWYDLVGTNVVADIAPQGWGDYADNNEVKDYIHSGNQDKKQGGHEQSLVTNPLAPNGPGAKVTEIKREAVVDEDDLPI